MPDDQPSTPNPNTLTSCFWSGDALRSRRVGDRVLSDVVDIPAPPVRLLADWAREIATQMTLGPGDVEVMPLARARMRWPDYARCVQAAADWTASLGLPGLLAECDVALMVCRGARFHHDGDQYGGAAFCNLFLSESSEDSRQDVYFPSLDRRIALRRGTVLLFDTCQPHGVVPRGADRFDPADFPAGRDGQDNAQVFLTWELPIEDARVARLLGVAFDQDPAAAARARQEQAEQVQRNGQRLRVCPSTGQWLPIDLPD
ncbi:hypothetical protein [Cupriavidus sp.]|uniref:hypothetical protein n=1 Tax=Cupriavidus sp. TaxID=1873897 RepID=UPI0025C58581|nr:hypothetical protein [Cupriavidus sp.]MCA3190794.1 hypothetical protein [Cupriavidus sp.]MCA3199119.1 hypothetical protein [Cupriavidus sp.]MCA3205056.1 hypothetical protein [Cupriavidus sp.]MCA3209127.1 hypothetical protein [Cupriavidus sp.]